MSTKKMFTEVFRHLFSHRLYGNTRRIRADDCPRLAEAIDAREQIALDLQLFDHRLNDPINPGYSFEVIVEVPCLNETRELWRKEGRGLDFFRRFETCVDDSISHLL